MKLCVRMLRRSIFLIIVIIVFTTLNDKIYKLIYKYKFLGICRFQLLQNFIHFLQFFTNKINIKPNFFINTNKMSA